MTTLLAEDNRWEKFWNSYHFTGHPKNLAA
jgi:hypothetical protein